MPRYDRLDQIGRVRVYDNGGKTVDRFSVLFEDMDVYDGISTTPTKPRPYGPRQGLYLSENPSHPQGVSIWDEIRPPQTYGTGSRHRRIPFTSLPKNVQEHVIRRATEDE